MPAHSTVIVFDRPFQVPRSIVRIDHRHTHGWQLRFGRSRFFADQGRDAEGAAAALARATRLLRQRMAVLPAPTPLKERAGRNKRTALPVGISGPVERLRPGRGCAHYYLQVCIPVLGGRPRNCSVYIGTANTVDEERMQRALAKAIARRDEGLRVYRRAATAAMRAAVRDAPSGRAVPIRATGATASTGQPAPAHGDRREPVDLRC